MATKQKGIRGFFQRPFERISKYFLYGAAGLGIAAGVAVLFGGPQAVVTGPIAAIATAPVWAPLLGAGALALGYRLKTVVERIRGRGQAGNAHGQGRNVNEQDGGRDPLDALGEDGAEQGQDAGMDGQGVGANGQTLGGDQRQGQQGGRDDNDAPAPAHLGRRDSGFSEGGNRGDGNIPYGSNAGGGSSQQLRYYVGGDNGLQETLGENDLLSGTLVYNGQDFELHGGLNGRHAEEEVLIFKADELNKISKGVYNKFYAAARGGELNDKGQGVQISYKGGVPHIKTVENYNNLDSPPENDPNGPGYGDGRNNNNEFDENFDEVIPSDETNLKLQDPKAPPKELTPQAKEWADKVAAIIQEESNPQNALGMLIHLGKTCKEEAVDAVLERLDDEKVREIADEKFKQTRNSLLQDTNTDRRHLLYRYLKEVQSDGTYKDVADNLKIEASNGLKALNEAINTAGGLIVGGNNQVAQAFTGGNGLLGVTPENDSNYFNQDTRRGGAEAAPALGAVAAAAVAIQEAGFQSFNHQAAYNAYQTADPTAPAVTSRESARSQAKSEVLAAARAIAAIAPVGVRSAHAGWDALRGRLGQASAHNKDLEAAIDIRRAVAYQQAHRLHLATHAGAGADAVTPENFRNAFAQLNNTNDAASRTALTANVGGDVTVPGPCRANGLNISVRQLAAANFLIQENIRSKTAAYTGIELSSITRDAGGLTADQINDTLAGAVLRLDRANTGTTPKSVRGQWEWVQAIIHELPAAMEEHQIDEFIAKAPCISHTQRALYKAARRVGGDDFLKSSNGGARGWGDAVAQLPFTAENWKEAASSMQGLQTDLSGRSVPRKEILQNALGKAELIGKLAKLKEAVDAHSLDEDSAPNHLRELTQCKDKELADLLKVQVGGGAPNSDFHKSLMRELSMGDKAGRREKVAKETGIGDGGLAGFVATDAQVAADELNAILGEKLKQGEDGMSRPCLDLLTKMYTLTKPYTRDVRPTTPLPSLSELTQGAKELGLEKSSTQTKGNYRPKSLSTLGIG